MPIGRKPRISIATLLISHGLVIFAGFFAPYDYAAQDRELPFAPPTRLHFLDTAGKLHLRPFVYRQQVTGGGNAYCEDTSMAYPVQFLVRGSSYVVVGGWIARTHLFGTEEPARIFLMGSDGFGRDQLTRFLYGGQISLFAGLLATCISLVLGLTLGATAGFYGGWLDELIMRSAEVFLALPWLYLLFAVRAFLPLEIAPGHVFLLLITVLGVVGWARPARLVRGVVLSAKERDYVLAAQGFGASDFYLLRRHVWPEASSVALIQAAVFVPRYVLAEVVLSFFGLGVSEPTPSWGNMLASLRQYDVLESDWWIFLPMVGLMAIFLAYYRVFSYYGYYFGKGAGMRDNNPTRMTIDGP